MDAHLDVLRDMHLTGGIFLDAEFTAPWSISAQVGPEDCAPYTPEPRHIIAYHYVTAGRLLLLVAGEAPIPVQTGELVVLPRNDVHVLASEAGLQPVDAATLITALPEGGLARIVYGGGGAQTRLVCGFLGSDVPRNPLITNLPKVLKLSVTESASGRWIESSFRFATEELALPNARSMNMLAKIAELLFLEAIRRYLSANDPQRLELQVGVRDPMIARALNLIHSRMDHHWTTEHLAREVGLSRSAFADRFSKALKEPPMGYLTRYRLTQASLQLVETSTPIPRISSSIGYESEAAFNRAFKRLYGKPPAAWRKEKQSVRSRS